MKPSLASCCVFIYLGLFYVGPVKAILTVFGSKR